MGIKRGGFLIYFDEAQRNFLLKEVRNLEHGFSDAFSTVDWELKTWEVCGLLFEPEVITHWALARKTKKVATGKAKVEFTEITPCRISLRKIDNLIGESFKHHFVRSRSGLGGKVPPGTWGALKEALHTSDPSSFEVLERLERLRDRGCVPMLGDGVQNVALQKDAVGLAFNIFEQDGRLRKQTIPKWVPRKSDRLTSFLEGLKDIRTIEDQLIARDAAIFPELDDVRHTVAGAVFSSAGRKLEVFNVNRTAIETSLGVDLLYYNDQFDAWTLVQYKCIEERSTEPDRSAIYRPDNSFNAELGRMQQFRKGNADKWDTKDAISDYRLSGDGFFFKFCTRVQMTMMSSDLLPGLYLPRQYVECLLKSPAGQGPNGGLRIKFDQEVRHLSNTLFADLVRDGWIGSRGISSTAIAQVLKDKLSAGRSIVLARSRASEQPANLQETVGEFGLLPS